MIEDLGRGAPARLSEATNPVPTLVLYESGRTRVMRCELPGAAHPVVVKRALNADAAERLRHEIHVLDRLATVPGVVKLADVPASAQDLGECLVMHDDGGISLAQTLTQRVV